MATGQGLGPGGSLSNVGGRWMNQLFAGGVGGPYDQSMYTNYKDLDRLQRMYKGLYDYVEPGVSENWWEDTQSTWSDHIEGYTDTGYWDQEHALVGSYLEDVKIANAAWEDYQVGSEMKIKDLRKKSKGVRSGTHLRSMRAAFADHSSEFSQKLSALESTRTSRMSAMASQRDMYEEDLGGVYSQFLESAPDIPEDVDMVSAMACYDDGGIWDFTTQDCKEA